MGAARKIEMFPEEQYVEAALGDGRAYLDEAFSMKALGKPDMSLQQRVVDFSPEHLSRLGRMILDGERIYPIVVFRDPTSGKLRIADGFHRWKAHLNAKMRSIRAYVIEGDYREALMFSTMCNRLAMLGRTSKDIKKAVMALLEDKEWQIRAVQHIADHVGCSAPTVTKWRTEFFVARGEQPPDLVTKRDGIRLPSKRNQTGRPAISRTSSGGYVANIKGETTYLGRDKDQAEEKLADRLKREEQATQSLEPKALVTRFERAGLSFKATALNKLWGLGSPRYGHGVMWVSIEGECDIPKTHGRVRLARQLVDPSARAVVICYPDRLPLELLAAALADGVEYLAPEELIASIQGATQTGSETTQ